MRLTYKGYTLILDFGRRDFKVPTKVLELNHTFEDISIAKRYIDTL